MTANANLIVTNALLFYRQWGTILLPSIVHTWGGINGVPIGYKHNTEATHLRFWVDPVTKLTVKPEIVEWEK